MSWMAPDVVNYCETTGESANLKIALTPLPTPLTALALAGGLAVAVEGAEPAPIAPFVESGVSLRTSFEDWYYRIHVIPAALALGNVAGDLAREITVWNAYLSPVTLEGATLTADQGLELTDGPDAPYEIGPLEELRYILRVSGSGSSTIDATATWTIDGQAYEVPITGRRSVLFGFRPNWSTRVQETYEWRNTLTTTYSGFEQVMSTRTEPRRILEYAFRLHGAEMRLFDSAAFGWTGRVFGLPWWPERTSITQDTPAGANIVYMDTTARSFVAGGTAVIYESADDFDVLDLAEVFADRLVARNQTTRAWPRGSRAYPVLSAIPGAEIATNRAVPTHVDGSVRFTMVPTDAVLNLPLEPAPFAYRGYEMYTGETNWRAPMGLSIAARRKEIDGRTGPLSIRRKTDFPLVVRGFSWMVKSQVQARELLALLARRQGRRYPMWMPSGVEDFKLAADILGGQNSILVERTAHGAMIGNNEARRDIVFLLRNGTALARRIIDVSDDGPNSRVTLAEAIPQDLTRGAVKRLSYLGLYRLGADAVTLSWATGLVAEVDVNFVLKKDRT